MSVKGKNAAFSAAAMFANLGGEDPSRLSRVGFVKPDDGDPGAVHLALPPHSDRWVKIPEAHIRNYEALGTLQLGDQDHQLVRLHLKAPESADALLFHDLLLAHRAAPATAGRAPLGEPTMAGLVCYFDLATGKYVCK